MIGVVLLPFFPFSLIYSFSIVFLCDHNVPSIVLNMEDKMVDKSVQGSAFLELTKWWEKQALMNLMKKCKIIKVASITRESESIKTCSRKQ